MARFDCVGMFWDEEPAPKPPKKEKHKPVPPDQVWLRPDYLPNLAEALAFKPDLFTDMELVQAAAKKEVLFYDIECYPNYFLIAFKSRQSGKSICFEMGDGETIDTAKLRWIMLNFQLVDFNGENYDKWIAQLAIAGHDCRKLHQSTVKIIEENEAGWKVLRSYKIKQLKDINRIDLIELTPGQGDNEAGIGGVRGAGLKTIAGRLHAPMMMDLPFKPGTVLSREQKIITRWYCYNDLDNTRIVYDYHFENIKMREQVGAKYNIDLRSKSDAQMAEAIFRAEARRRGREIDTKDLNRNYDFKFDMPACIKFQTPNLQWVYKLIQSLTFHVNEHGYVNLPDRLKSTLIPIGEAKYQMGIGGLHSTEKNQAYQADDEWILRDHDVASYYPKLMLEGGIEPPRLKGMFFNILSTIVDTRLAAKKRVQMAEKAGQKPADADVANADGLKIVVNGSFGKTLDPYSCLNHPKLGIQTTLGGQLRLLMAIERLELAGIQVINANTDGIVVRCRKSQEAQMQAIFKQWEKDTGLEMETTDYALMLSRDVNNYMSVKPDGKAKVKGVFAKTNFKKNPVNEICVEAALAYIQKRVPIEKTIKECRRITAFTAIRRVSGGGVKVWEDGTVEFIGKMSRFYHSTEVKGIIVTAKKGHAVAGSENCRPYMRLGEFPPDVDYDWYIEESKKFLEQTGYMALMDAQHTLVPV